MSLKFIISVTVLFHTFHFINLSPHDIHERGKVKGLSDVPHNTDSGEHDARYDHEVFLGKEESEKFDQLTPEQSKEKLRKIIERIDKDSNESITQQELNDWITYVSERYIREDSDRRWNDIDGDSDKMDWAYYKKRTYGDQEDTRTDPNEIKMIRKIIKTEKSRFIAADQDKDGILTKEEFLAFAHPDNFPHMTESTVSETMGDIDTDNDGFISVDEYMRDLWNPDSAPPGEEKPEYYDSEQERFHEERDRNKDGKLDREELREWLKPTGYDPIKAEVEHLFHHADQNKDKLLSIDEILDKADLFVGSQATNYGEALKKHHTEL